MTWVTDDIFVAGGDFVRDYWTDFQAQAGVSAVITISADGPVAYRNPLPWAALWLPVDDEAGYSLSQLALGVSFIQAALVEGHKVLLHGPRGVHRTRPLLAAHLLAEGKSLARTLRTVEEKPWLPPYKGDRAVLEQFADQLGMNNMGDTVFIGIDPTAGRRPMNYAVLDAELKPIVLEATGGLMEVLGAVGAYPRAIVAVDAPQSANAGLMASPEYRAGLTPPPASGRWLGYKVCEYLLRQRGIGLYATPGDEAAAPTWMQMGFQLYAGLRAAGFERYRQGSAARRQVLEVHPHACFTVLLGHLPTPKNLIEGRLQRQLVLYYAGLAVPDPMEALEELTEHHLLAGNMDLPGLLSHDALDALAAAYTAFLASTAPDKVTPIGDAEEGQIVLPVAPDELKGVYARPR